MLIAFMLPLLFQVTPSVLAPVAILTGWDVLSDAVKIGLGAAIGLAGAWFTRRNDWDKERKKNRRDLLLRLADEFDAGHQKFVTFFLDAISKKQLDFKVDTPLELITEGRQQIQSAEAKLVIMGAIDAAEKARNHLDLVAQFLSAMKSDAPKPRSADFSNPLTTSRRDFLSALQVEFEKLSL